MDEGAAGRRRIGRAVVTGGAGFLGSHLCERLLRDGAKVVCVDSFLTGDIGNIAHLVGPRFSLVRADVARSLPVEGTIDAVFHLASPASPPAYRRYAIETLLAGADGTRNALELAARAGAVFVLASTSEVYGDPLEHPQRENYRGNVDPTGPRSMYDEAKRYAEALAVAYAHAQGVPVRIARIFNTCGPRLRAGDGRLVPSLAAACIEGRPMTIHGDGRQTRSLAYVEDTVEALVRLASSPYDRPVNVGNPDERSVLQIAELVARAAGVTDAEAVVVATDWPEFHALDLDALRDRMLGDVVLDGRNVLAGRHAERSGLRVLGAGWHQRSA